MFSHPRRLWPAIAAMLMGLAVLVGCPSADDDVEPEPTAEPDDVQPCSDCLACEECLTCEECHTDQEMLVATVEPPEEPDGETEGAGEG